MIVIPPLISSFILCVLILLAGEGFLHFLFGCGRHFKMVVSVRCGLVQTLLNVLSMIGVIE